MDLPPLLQLRLDGLLGAAFIYRVDQDWVVGLLPLGNLTTGQRLDRGRRGQVEGDRQHGRLVKGLVLCEVARAPLLDNSLLALFFWRIPELYRPRCDFGKVHRLLGPVNRAACDHCLHRCWNPAALLLPSAFHDRTQVIVIKLPVPVEDRTMDRG